MNSQYRSFFASIFIILSLTFSSSTSEDVQEHGKKLTQQPKVHENTDNLDKLTRTKTFWNKSYQYKQYQRQEALGRSLAMRTDQKFKLKTQEPYQTDNLFKGIPEAKGYALYTYVLLKKSSEDKQVNKNEALLNAVTDLSTGGGKFFFPVPSNYNVFEVPMKFVEGNEKSYDYDLSRKMIDMIYSICDKSKAYNKTFHSDHLKKNSGPFLVSTTKPLMTKSINCNMGIVRFGILVYDMSHIADQQTKSVVRNYLSSVYRDSTHKLEITNLKHSIILNYMDRSNEPVNAITLFFKQFKPVNEFYEYYYQEGS